MGRNKRIIISGYYGFNNSGDDAILKAIIKDFKKSNSSIEITALSNDPLLTEKVYGVDAINRFKMRNVIKAIKGCDLFISGGGSLLQDVTSTRSILYYIALMKLAKRYNKPIMVYANGIGPINKKINRVLTKNILDKVDLITLRDKDSRVFLDELGVKNKNIYVTADPVFTLEPSKDAIIDNIFKEEGVKSDKPLVGISVRNWTNSESLINNLSKAVDYMISEYKVNVIIIPMHYPKDLSISKSILDKVTKEGCYVISNRHSVEDIMGIIKRLEIIIAMRLHSLIYAATQDIPMVGIVYDPKIEGFLKSIGMEHMCKVENVNYTQLVKNIDYVWKNKDELRNKLMKSDKRMKEQALKNVSMALDLLKE